MTSATYDGAGAANSGHDLRPGDLCHHGANVLPLYRVIWIDAGKVWLRDVNNGTDSVVALERCRGCMEGEPGSEPSAKPTPVTWPDGTPRP